MKKFIFLLIALTCTFAAKAQDFVEFTVSESTNPQYDIISSNDTLVKFNVIVPGMFETAIDTFMRINVKEHTKMDSVGFPEIPIVSFLVAAPECDSVNMNIALMDSVQYTGYNIYPAPELVPDTAHGGAIALIEQFSYNRTAYETDAMFPGTVAETIDKGAIRAQHVVRVVLYPVQFNPVKDIIKAYSSIEVSLAFYNASGNIQQDVGIFNEIVGNTLINYNSNGLNASVNCGAGLEESGTIKWVTSFPNDYVEDSCDYLIITHNNFYTDPVAKSEIETLAQHRADFNGFNVVMTQTSSIYAAIPDSITVDIDKKIKIFLHNTYENGNAYHTYDGKLAYVNLFGDAFFGSNPLDVCVPTHSEGYDVYFTQLTCDTIIIGNDTIIDYDVYPDLMIGRCSVDDTTQVKNVVHKVLNFKPEDLDYKDDMLTIASSEDFYSLQSVVLSAMDEIIPGYYNKELMLDPGFNYPYPQWDSIPCNVSALQNSYKAGKMFINYMDHGSSSAWSYPTLWYYYIDSTYDNKLPFILSGACLTGRFHVNNNNLTSEDCMAEHFLVEDSIRGAIGFVGSSIITASSTFNMISSYYNSLLRNYSNVLGEAIMEGKIGFSGWRDEYNLFGDPALNILYENSDTIKPDLIVKANETGFNSEDLCFNDTIHIYPVIKNIFWKNANEPFYVSCVAIETTANDTIWLGNQLINGLAGYSKDTLEFVWTPSNILPSKYKFVLKADTTNMVSEMNELNNSTTIEKTIYGFQEGFSISSDYGTVSHPVSFDMLGEYDGEEIVFGEKTVSSQGEIIESYSIGTEGLTSIGDLWNDGEYQVVQVNVEPTPPTIVANWGANSWMYPLSNDYYGHTGPFVVDMDNNGKEEIVLLQNTFDQQSMTSATDIVCVNYDGNLRWEYSFPDIDYLCTHPVFVNLGSETTTILLIDDTGKICFLNESPSQDMLLLTDSLIIPNY